MPQTMKDLVARAKQEIEEVDVEEAERRLDDGAVAIDVREADELERGYLPGAVHIPRGMLEMQVPQRPETQDPDTPVVVYCQGGGRCALAAQTLRTMGYTNVASLAGGFGAWVEAGHEVALPSSAATDEEE